MIMTKFTQQEGNINLKHITRSEIEQIATKHNYGWQTLYDCLKGLRRHDIGRPERRAMVKEALDLIHSRIINDYNVINPQHLKQ